MGILLLAFCFLGSDLVGNLKWGGLGFVPHIESLSMGTLIDEHFNVEVENGVKFGGCVEERGESCAIEDSVRVLVQCLGEDINREGLRKTPFRVAKALREGTTGDSLLPLIGSLSLSLSLNFCYLLA